MKVENPLAARANSLRSAKRKDSSSSGVSFADMLGADASNNVDDVGSIAAISQFVAVLGASPDYNQQHAKQHGDKMLDALEKVRIGLLSGEVSQGNLIQLKALLAEQAHDKADPSLASVLQEIEVRVAVEIAKLEKNI